MNAHVCAYMRTYMRIGVFTHKAYCASVHKCSQHKLRNATAKNGANSRIHMIFWREIGSEHKLRNATAKMAQTHEYIWSFGGKLAQSISYATPLQKWRTFRNMHDVCREIWPHRISHFARKTLLKPSQRLICRQVGKRDYLAGTLLIKLVPAVWYVRVHACVCVCICALEHMNGCLNTSIYDL
jgi:hypothetical protein